MQLVSEKDSALATPCPAYDFATQTYEERMVVVDEMIQLMVETRGVGLAAPQIGVLTHLFVIEADGARFPCYNATIVEASPEMASDVEGCLSFPGLYFKVNRPSWVIGKFQDAHGQEITRRFDGLAARCYQHELEHLQGVCFTSKVGPLTLQMAQKRRIKHRKNK